MVAGLQPDLAALDEGGGPGLVAGQPLEQEGADHRAAQRPRGPRPLDRRAGVEQQAVRHAGDDLPRRGDLL